MVTTPIISVPYERIACDIVGPLYKTRDGNRHILTVMCLAIRYPYSIPLKRVDTESLAEGLMEVIAHTGIPKELLTDQGGVFTSKVFIQACKLLNIRKLKTTAYHPQTNGILERWHRWLKDALRCQRESGREWDKLLKYCLLAYRAIPHRSTGFSPYELVNGHPLRGPLEAIRDGWLGGELTWTSTAGWVKDLREILSRLHESARSHQIKNKEMDKEAYDKKAKERSFEPGDMVLLHNSSVSASLDSIWEGPYEVLASLPPTSYRIAVPDKRSHVLTTHVNRLKRWKNPTANLFKVVVARDSEGCDESVGKIQMGVPKTSDAQKRELDDILAGFSDVVTTELGRIG